MRWASWALTFVLLGGCDLPRDPENTLRGATRRGEIRVGVTEAPPFVRRPTQDPQAEPVGVEADLIREFARVRGLRVQWVWGPLDAHYAALETFALDLAAGAITKETPWRRRVGLTKPYITSRIVVGTPPEQREVRTLEGLRVTIEPGHPWEQELRSRGAEVFVAARPFTQHTAVAAPEWQLAAHGYRIADIDPLAEEKHVLAVPPGENRWLAVLEAHVLGREQEIARSLIAEERR